MIGDYVKEIQNILEKITKENKENMDNIVHYATSLEVNVGGMLCRYGELYKIILDSESFDEILYSLEQASYKDKFEAYYDEIKEIQEQVFEYIKDNEQFTNGREHLLRNIKEEYIMGVIIERL